MTLLKLTLIWIPILLVGLTLAGGSAAVNGVSSTCSTVHLPFDLLPGQTTGLIVPLYIYPGVAWNQMITQK